MTKKILILLFFLGSFLMQSQNLVWRTNMTDAIAISNEQRKPMLILFTASGVPDNLQNEIFKTPDFAVWSRDNVILVKLDLSDINASDSDKEQNLRLKNAFGVVDLPEVCYASASIRKNKTTFSALGKIAYKPGGARSWISESDAILHPSE
ncbi:MAG: thioredoxin family protein [Flavobacterium circumlabens]|uniref:Protein disulfide-isomerase n=1 Tax=Flavobacterium circumlabens TaxID=2133765 RepID=A0A4Y7UHM2_9FLAO|nr:MULTISPECIES: thioredoxin family protein [Flavobacterium]QSB26971.1 thioredoxin family protein [Flavobacterium sp. CLA17]TCN60762.1 protein disulfide-isomerase [Flavobacterium circumlabens]TEB45904.1 thioredoxin family protein [Flavobacterium circumlabens]